MLSYLACFGKACASEPILCRSHSLILVGAHINDDSKRSHILPDIYCWTPHLRRVPFNSLLCGSLCALCTRVMSSIVWAVECVMRRVAAT